MPTDKSTLRLPADNKQERPAVRTSIDPRVMAAIENEQEGDKYYYDRSVQPTDMDYNFKRLTYGGVEDKAHQMALKRKGWQHVPRERHPECSTEDPDNKYIVIGGQILMERHKAYSQKAAELEQARNTQQVSGQFERLQLGGNEHMPRKVTTMKQSYEAGQDIPA